MNDVNSSDSFENITFDYPNINIGIAVTATPLVLVTVFANLMIIIAFWKINAFGEKPSDIFILVLACVDLFVGMVIIPTYMSVLTFGRWIFGEIGCQCLIFLALTAITNGPLVICCICLDRLLLVKMEYPRYVKFQSKTKVLLTVAICFLLALTQGTADLCFWNYAKSVGVIRIDYDYACLSPVRFGAPEISLLFLFLCMLFPVLLVGALSVAFLYSLRLRLQRIRRVTVRPEGESKHGAANTLSSETVRNHYLKPAMTLGALVLALAIAIMPYTYYVIIIGTIWPEYLNPKVVYGIVLTLFCKSIFDPVMYAVSESKIRKFYITRVRELTNRW